MSITTIVWIRLAYADVFEDVDLHEEHPRFAKRTLYIGVALWHQSKARLSRDDVQKEFGIQDYHRTSPTMQ